MSKRRGSSGTGEAAKLAARHARAAIAAMPRHRRQHGGPPAHILAKQAAEQARFAARRAADTAASRAQPSVPLVPLRLVSSQPERTPIATAPPIPRRAALRRWTVARSAAALLFLPLGTVAGLLLAVDSQRPVITADDRITAQIAAMTPVPVLAIGPPAVVPPGHIVFSSMRLADGAPHIAPSAPMIVPPLPATLTIELAEDLKPRQPGSIAFAAFALPSSPPEISALGLVAIAPLTETPTKPTPEVPQFREQVVPPPQLIADNTCRQPEAAAPLAAANIAPDRFGVALAAAALTQIEQFVIYDARYTRIAYPAGDVPSLYGVCTDVVIRAYRALGIDLQERLQQSRLRGGDTSIDHRRTETLRRYFDLYGERVAITAFAEDYLPGDIVTYYRPQNKTSTSHIAIVSDRLAPSGRPMIIHNRGHGVQLEDGLFVDRITGHYRYTAPTAAPITANVLRGPAMLAAARLAALAAREPAGVRVTAKAPAVTRVALRLTASSTRGPMTSIPLLQSR